MPRVVYEEIQTRSALNRVRGMGFKWSLNPYQGCAHGCHYCFARRYHYFRNLNPDDDFSGVISVKLDVHERLRQELSRPSWRHETVALGTATDPYQPIDGKYRLTRRCLEVFCQKRSPIGLVTKGTLIVRDQDLLVELSKRAGCTICFSITTLDEDLRRRLEPGTPPARKRLQAMERLVLGGVNAGVLLAPIMPGITDGVANLTEVVRGAAEHGARFLSGNALYLKEGTKDHFLAFLKQEYPGLLETYAGLYPGAFVPPHMKESLQKQIAGLRGMYGLKQIHEEPEMTHTHRQLQLAI